MKLSDFDYKLPQGLIAQYPAASRELSRMLVLNRTTGEITHTDFRDFSNYVNSNDVVVLNNTKVINARLFGRRVTGGKVEIFLISSLGEGRYKALIKPSARVSVGEEIAFGISSLKARLLVKNAAWNTIEFISASDGVDISRELDRLGNIPLPPYIKRKAEPLDNERYQTVYAEKGGATASPTAGLHFTNTILDDIANNGTQLAYVTLHVNYGTFAPVKTEVIEEHKMYSEDFELTKDACEKINRVKTSSGRVLAVGTTTCRVLETCAVQVTRSPSHHVTRYKVEPKKGKTDLFVYPGYKFKIVDAMLTNFHFPKSTLLMLVCAFAGRELIFKAYEEAIVRKYRFFSYGDCMLII